MPLRHTAPHDQNDQIEPQLSLDVGWLRITDLWFVRAIHERYALNQPSPSTNLPIVAGVRQALPFLPTAERVFVARSERYPVGYAIFRVCEPDGRWELEGIGANLGVYEAEPVWDELLRFGVVSAGLEGAKRIYARIPRRSGLVPVVRTSGFTPYATEMLFRGGSSGRGNVVPRVRRQQPSDVWAIHQLYLATTPQPVQFAEARTSHYWEIQPRLFASCVKSGWIIDNGPQISAYVRAISRPEFHLLEFTLLPDHKECFPDLLDGALGGLSEMSPRPVYITVRGYQIEQIRHLADREFTLFLEQELMIKHTTSMVRASAAIVSFPQDVKDTVGKRVPTFLNDSPRDPAQGTPV